jgi:hypothetical protein
MNGGPPPGTGEHQRVGELGDLHLVGERKHTGHNRLTSFKMTRKIKSLEGFGSILIVPGAYRMKSVSCLSSPRLLDALKGNWRSLVY